jgi:hypothetical protein
MVGERGAELFVPGRSGQIVPNDIVRRTTAGGGSVINYAPVIDARGADAGAVARIEAVLRAQEQTFSARVGGVMHTNRVRRVRF